MLMVLSISHFSVAVIGLKKREQYFVWLKFKFCNLLLSLQECIYLHLNILFYFIFQQLQDFIRVKQKDGYVFERK